MHTKMGSRHERALSVRQREKICVRLSRMEWTPKVGWPENSMGGPVAEWWRIMALACDAEMAAVTSVALRYVLPLRVPRCFCLPALSWLAGQTPAQAARRWAVPNAELSTTAHSHLLQGQPRLSPQVGR